MKFSNNFRPGSRKQYELQAKYLATEAVTRELTVNGGMSPLHSNDTSQLFTPFPENYLSLLGILEHPFSRGSTHISSLPPSAYPTLNSNYLSRPFDLTGNHNPFFLL